MEIRNIAIIAHVDHGKTTLVDGLLKQTHTFRDNQKEMDQTLIMDSHDLEKERGITILAKNTSIFYKGSKINIIDTPGHADFGGEVERTLNMASGALLLVDAAEGVLPQTKFVLKKALEYRLKIIVMVNKIDKRDARPEKVVKEIEDLFLELASHESSLDHTLLYGVGREGKAFLHLPVPYEDRTEGNLSPLLDLILRNIPNSNIASTLGFRLLVSTLDYDLHVGKICIGKVSEGCLKKGDPVVLLENNRILGKYQVTKLFTSIGLERKDVDEVQTGDIVGIAGIPKLTIGQTVASPQNPVSFPEIKVTEPTIRVTIGPNTSPFSGKEAIYSSSAEIKKRLLREKETNLGLRIEEERDTSAFTVSGRGELHLAILLETMRREGYEFEISKPQVIFGFTDGIVTEPFEEVTIDTDSSYIGVVSEEMGKRKAQLLNMEPIGETGTRFKYRISSRNLLGLRSILLTKTRGTALISTYLLGYYPKLNTVESHRNGALIAYQTGTALAFGLESAQERGDLFIGPGTQVYEGMVVGISKRDQDMEVNVCKGKKLTNVRNETADIAVILTPPINLTLEKALDLLVTDELLEVTPKDIRIRKKHLNAVKRKVLKRADRSTLTTG